MARMKGRKRVRVRGQVRPWLRIRPTHRRAIVEALNFVQNKTGQPRMVCFKIMAAVGELRALQSVRNK